MGAAEWTGYTNAPYTGYSSNAAALPQPPPAAAAPTTAASTYGYESVTAGMADHPSNFHIPTGNFEPLAVLFFPQLLLQPCKTAGY